MTCMIDDLSDQEKREDIWRMLLPNYTALIEKDPTQATAVWTLNFNYVLSEAKIMNSIYARIY